MNGTPGEPDEHARFAAYLAELRHVPEANEAALLARVLRDPDRTMAGSAVLRHLDRRAAELRLAPGYDDWAEAMARTVAGHAFLTQRLQEWRLLRAVSLELPWRVEEVLAASDWLQLTMAAESHVGLLRVLAEGGRTRRIRHAAGVNLMRRDRD